MGNELEPTPQTPHPFSYAENTKPIFLFLLIGNTPGIEPDSIVHHFDADLVFRAADRDGHMLGLGVLDDIDHQLTDGSKEKNAHILAQRISRTVTDAPNLDPMGLLNALGEAA